MTTADLRIEQDPAKILRGLSAHARFFIIWCTGSDKGEPPMDDQSWEYALEECEIQGLIFTLMSDNQYCFKFTPLGYAVAAEARQAISSSIARLKRPVRLNSRVD